MVAHAEPGRGQSEGDSVSRCAAVGSRPNAIVRFVAAAFVSALALVLAAVLAVSTLPRPSATG
jgi:hypothetical protein